MAVALLTAGTAAYFHASRPGEPRGLRDAVADKPSAAGDECVGGVIPKEQAELAGLKTQFFKRYSMYTRGGKYDPSEDLVYFTALNFHLGNNLTVQEYARAEEVLGRVPGEGPLAPTIEMLLPQMWKYLEAIKANTSGREAAQEYAGLLMADMKTILPEALGGNRLSYAVVESGTQFLVRAEGTDYIVRLEGCPGRLTLLDMSGYSRFSSFAEERADLRARLGKGDVPRFTLFVMNSLDDRSYFRKQLSRLLAAGR